jgi:hypothetical protein
MKPTIVTQATLRTLMEKNLTTAPAVYLKSKD